MLRAIELRLLRMAYNPLVKDPFVGCIFGLLLSLGLSLGLSPEPWAYNITLMLYGLYIVRKSSSAAAASTSETAGKDHKAQERYALGVYLSMWADIVFGLAWGWSVITPPYSEKTVVRHAVQAAVFVELVLIKNAIAKAVAWRLRDQGHEFESVFLNWHARAVYGNYFGQVAEDEAEKGAFTPEKAA